MDLQRCRELQRSQHKQSDRVLTGTSSLHNGEHCGEKGPRKCETKTSSCGSNKANDVSEFASDPVADGKEASPAVEPLLSVRILISFK